MVCDFLDKLSEIIDDRFRNGGEGSYTHRLYVGGLGLISKKVGEEAVEVVVAAMSGDREQVVRETADLVYHLLVLLRYLGIGFDNVCAELVRRHEVMGSGR
ncbi:phosphoribosyl-ATP diphosphatase [Vulcanisaeta thermophila]|uniref:phosphoribosyl-ATP diphosphatase n=1 Tax=Vulcanisaeta thermophila TaxID=867917 RepID=UPI000852B780|nr:phosphoribosyl-ATP diphosphatase [Vulcanisaeta thermophila]